jgi:rubredoxin
VKEIVVFKKCDNSFSLLRDFDNEDDLNLWLDNTCENKEELFMKQLKRRSKYKCKSCSDEVFKSEIIKAPKNYLDITPSYNRNFNLRVCPSCGVIFDNNEGFENMIKS